MPRRFGVPFGMSKNRIAADIIDFLPPAESFVDLFAGGCAITQAALESGKYKRVFCNDIDAAPVGLFLDAITGKMQNERRVIDRETFQKLKDSDAYVRFCWSFGCKGGTYLWSREIERVKIAACRLILQPGKESRRIFAHEFRAATGDEIPADALDFIAEPEDWNERRRRYMGIVRGKYPRKFRDLEALERLKALERLQRLGRLHSLWRLEPLERLASLGEIEARGALIVSNVDYRAVKIPDGALIYCDIPYTGSTVNREMNMAHFDFQAFCSWSKQQKNIFISSYEMPPEFEAIWEKRRRSIMSDADNTTTVVEKLFIPREKASKCADLHLRG